MKDNHNRLQITSKEDLLMKSLMIFYSNEHNRSQLIPIVEHTSPIALRVLDWFVTNYSKQYDIMYNIKDNNGIRQFIVHSNYRAKLKGHSKKLFDPFCRRCKIDFEYDENHIIETSIGQLHFFRWAIENKVLDYVYNNLETITEDMKLRCSNSKNRDPNKPKKELSISAAKTITKHDVTVTVTFS